MFNFWPFNIKKKKQQRQDELDKWERTGKPKQTSTHTSTISTTRCAPSTVRAKTRPEQTSQIFDSGYSGSSWSSGSSYGGSSSCD